MALTAFQRAVCRLLADQRLASGDSDINLFHDTEEALEASWDSDQRTLREHGCAIRIVRQRSSFVEAEVSRDGETVLLEWARDSAYRFFPLVEHGDFGLTLHPFDLATNKILALVGRLEVRDWIDVIHCGERIQPLGYLAWAACGKDPGFSPAGILEHASRSTHYAASEVLALSFEGEPPDPAALSRRWHAMLTEARDVVQALPPPEVGRCVLDPDAGLFAGGITELRESLDAGRLVFHPGRIRGALPRVKSTD